MSKPNLGKGRPGTRLQLGQPGPYWKANLDMTSTSTIIIYFLSTLLLNLSQKGFTRNPTQSVICSINDRKVLLLY